MHNYRNVLIEINNECDIPKYDHKILQPERVHESIELAKSKEKDGYSCYVSTSYHGSRVPDDKVVQVSDFIWISAKSWV